MRSTRVPQTFHQHFDHRTWQHDLVSMDLRRVLVLKVELSLFSCRLEVFLQTQTFDIISFLTADLFKLNRMRVQKVRAEDPYYSVLCACGGSKLCPANRAPGYQSSSLSHYWTPRPQMKNRRCRSYFYFTMIIISHSIFNLTSWHSLSIFSFTSVL